MTDGIDMLHDDIKALTARNDTLCEQVETLETYLMAIVGCVEFDGKDVYVLRSGGKHYLPDRLAQALIEAFDYLHTPRD